MSISRHPGKRWRARVRTADGRHRSKVFDLKADAQAWERTQMRHRDAGVTPSRLTVAQWSETWLRSARDVKASTIATYRRDLDRYILPALGAIPITRLTPQAIDAFLDAQPYAPSSVHRLYRTIHRLCQVAVERSVLAANPATAVRPPRVPRRPLSVLSVAEVERLADAISLRYRPVVLVAAFGGLRWGEIQGLRTDRISGRIIDVSEQLAGEGVKTASSRRQVVLPASVAEELAGHMERYPGTYVFTTAKGGPLIHSSFTQHIFKPALVAAGLDRSFRFHDLRHTAATLAIQAGAHPKVVAELLGHSSIRMSMDLYAKVTSPMLETLADDLEQLRRSDRI